MVALTILTLGISYITVSAQAIDTPIEASPPPAPLVVRDMRLQAEMASTSKDMVSASASLDTKEITDRLDRIIRLLSQINAKK